jgi:hypothetical protein
MDLFHLHIRAQNQHIIILIMADSDSEDDGVWEKPSWAKGGVQLKATGKAEAM